MKSFTRHNSYLRHLRSHAEVPSQKCTLESCGKVFRYRSDLTRHIKTHYKAPIRVFKNAVEANDMIDFEIDLEEKRIIGDYCGKLSVKQLAGNDSNYNKNYTLFESSLGVRNLEDWDVYVDLSNRFRVPLSSFKPS